MAEETTDWPDSGRTFQRDNRKVRPLVHIGDMQIQFQVGSADVELGRGMVNAGVEFCYGRMVKMNTYRGGSGWTGSSWPTSPGTAKGVRVQDIR